MRVVAGKHKGRRIVPPRGIDARPTTDHAREGLFNILRHWVPLIDIAVLDLYAGTGAVSLEFLSNGAERVVSVEQDQLLCEHMRHLADAAHEDQWHVIHDDALRSLSMVKGPFDIVFCDPPFALPGTEELPKRIFEADILEADGTVIVEHSARMDLSACQGFVRHRGFGAVHFSFFQQEKTP